VRRPALVLTDAMMPGMTGLELVTALRSEVAPPVPPVVVVSGFPALEPEARARGAVDFLHKPIGGEEMLEAVARVLARAPSDSRATELARVRVSRARRRVSRTAVQVMAALERAGEHLDRPAAQLAVWLSRYFGFGTATVVACPDAVRILGEASASSRPPIGELSAANPFFRDIAETSSSLLIADTEAYGALAPLATTGGIRFFAGVPVIVDGTSVGALAILDDHPQLFAAEDLSLLEHVGRRVGARLHAIAEGRPERVPEPLLDEAGRLSRTSFETVLAIEIRLAGEAGAAIAIGVADFAGPLGPSARRAQGGGARFAVGRLGPQRLAMFKRDESLERARAVLDAALAPADDEPALERAAVLALEAGAVSLVSGRLALDLVERGVAGTLDPGATTRVALTVQPTGAAACI
jgi:GAF domain-containing protein